MGDILRYTVVEDIDKEYKFKILVYPNITYLEDLEKDSFVVVLGDIIRELNKVRDDLHFTILLPTFVNSLAFKNVEQLTISSSTKNGKKAFLGYPNSMRMDFPFQQVYKAIDWRDTDFDIVYSHLPEHTGNLKCLLENTTNITPTIVGGYTHWTELKQITNYHYIPGLLYNITGLLEMKRCGVNTLAQKNLILDNAKEFFNRDVIKKLDEILVPQYLGWQVPYYKEQKSKKKIIVFNHRPHTYKNYPWFIKQMDKLWERRKDFEVWVPLANKKNKEYMSVEKFDRFGYLSKLSSCRVGVCSTQKYAGWSVSATDGMSVGVPYLFSDDDYYHELADKAGIYYQGDKQFQAAINNILDDDKLHKKYSKKSLDRFNECKWDKAIYQFVALFDEAIEDLVVLKEETESYLEIVKFIQKKKSVTKKEILDHMGWGVRIGFNGYRNRLRNEKTIRLTKNRYEVIK